MSVYNNFDKLKASWTGVLTLPHHYLGFLISKSHIQDLNPTFGFQKPNLAFTNLIYKRALTRVLKKNNLGFKNQIWLFKLSFENQIFQLENRISKTTFIFKTHIWFMYWNPNSFFENQICFISKNHVWFFETHMCVMKPKCEHCTKHKYGFVNPCLIFKTHMCVMKPKFDFYTKHKYGFVNPHLYFKANTHVCYENQMWLLYKTQIRCCKSEFVFQI